MTNKYKCKMCKGKLEKPEEIDETFWDNMQILMDVLWRDDYKYGLKDTINPDIFKNKLNGFEKVCKYKCCSDGCRSKLRKLSGIYVS